MRQSNPRITKMRAIRKARGWTIAECAEKLDIHTRTLSSYEQGRRAPEFPERIARILGVHLFELID